MEIKTFDTILTEMCDWYDTLIAPRTISRSNTNIIYLMFKAVAKGYEVIHNVCVALSNKFDPAKCSVEDLDSIASLVGTERLKGSATGLHVLVSNTKDTALTLPAGTYIYKQSDDVSFSFEVLSDTEVAPQSYVTFIAMSDSIGRYPVTAQSDLPIETEETVPDGIAFSCTANDNLLGKLPETNLEFRKRILEGYTGQDTMVELEYKLRNLPYLFDCRVRFNNTTNEQIYDGITVPPFTAVIFFSGEAKNEIAEVIADKMLFPTVQTEDAVTVTYYNDTLYTYTDQLSPKIKVSIPANQFVVGEKAYPITSSSLFGSLAGEIHSSDISGAPYNDLWYVLESLALDPNTITIEAVSTGAINTTIAAAIFTELRTFFSKPKLQYTQSKPDWAGAGIWQKEINLPESTKTGSKLFLKDITFNYPRQFPIYTHEPKDGYEYRFMFQAPISSRSYASERELNFSYYSFESPARVISDFTDSLESSSSADYSAVHVYWDAGYREVFTADTELPYKYYVHQSFYDSCIFEFTLPDKSVKSISLLDLFKTGLTLPAGITSIKLSAILLPNIESFVLNYFFKNNTTLINNLEPQHFYDALSAFSKINININIGYQSASEGIYIDTSKVRKLYIDEKEIESFIANE